jgi:hypothetical protein
MVIEFVGEVIYWRGPAPFYFVAMPEAESAELKGMAHLLTYGWGVIPVTVQCDAVTWTTSLFPKNGLYLVPVKNDVRKATGLQEGDLAELTLTFQLRD